MLSYTLHSFFSPIPQLESFQKRQSKYKFLKNQLSFDDLSWEKNQKEYLNSYYFECILSNLKQIIFAKFQDYN